MQLIGPDLRGGLFRIQFAGRNPAGPWVGTGIAFGLLATALILQFGCSLLAQILLFGSYRLSLENNLRGALIGVFPAALLTAVCAWQAARIKGGQPLLVLNLRRPRLGILGWPAVVVAFFISLILLFGVLMSIISAFGGAAGSKGIVEDTISGLAADPKLYLLVLPSVILGAPIWEELVFRGQVFTALSETRIGFVGAALITSAAWAGLHYTGNWIPVGLIFLMGLLFSTILVRFGSLWITMACHAMWNLTTSIVLYSVSS